jgi:predicted amidohydrolase YtcJ
VDERTRQIPIGDGLLIPGLMDSHTHIFMGSFTDVGVNLSHADTPEKLQVALEQIRDDQPGEEPIYARGWQNHLFPKSGPEAEILDTIFGDRVVILQSVDGHSTWFSSRALLEGGVDESFPDPEPGVSFFERDPLTNRPLGTAREKAGNHIKEAFIPGDKAAYKERLISWLPRASAAGLTSVFDAWAGAPTEEEAYQIWQELNARGALSLRVFGAVRELDDADIIAERFADYTAQYSNSMVRPEAVKMAADGVPEGHTAYLLTPYVDSSNEDFGKPMMSKAEMKANIETYFARNIPIHIHAIGGAAVRQSLDAIEAARAATQNQTVRATIAHMDFVHPDDIERFAALNVTAQTSIQWAARDPSYFNIGSFVGMEKVENAYPVRSIMDAGVNQSFGADWPASAYLSTYKPLELIESAITRRLPGEPEMPPRNLDQSVSLAEAIIAMTRNTAIQVGELDSLGSITEGKLADLVLLQKDLFDIPAETISATNVAMTVVNGEIVHEK